MSQDKELIAGYLAGRQKDFIVISNWITSIVHNDYWGLKDQWADILQDVRMKIYLNLKQNRFNRKSSLKTYVCRIAKYTCIDYLRKKYRREEKSSDCDTLLDSGDTFEALVHKEEKFILHQIFRELTERCRKTLQLVFIEGFSYKKIGSVLNVAEGTVKSRVSRCITQAIQLREKFYN